MDKAGRVSTTSGRVSVSRNGQEIVELHPGRIGLFAGKVSQYQRKRQLTHPDYNMLDAVENAIRNGSRTCR